MNKELLRMQKLAGLITESELKEKLSLKEGAFGDDKKAALENRLTGMAKAMVEDRDLFAEGGNVTYNENNLKA